MGEILHQKDEENWVELSTLMLGKGKFPCTSVVATICNLEAGKTVGFGTLLWMQVKLKEWDNSFRSREKNYTFTKNQGLSFLYWDD